MNRITNNSKTFSKQAKSSKHHKYRVVLKSVLIDNGKGISFKSNRLETKDAKKHLFLLGKYKLETVKNIIVSFK